MSDDIFDHPDLHDPEWARIARREQRRNRFRSRPWRTPRWLATYRRRIVVVVALSALVAGGALAVGSVERGATTTSDLTATATTQVQQRRVVTVAAGDVADELIIHTRYSVAYAFAPEDPSTISQPMDIVATVRADQDFAYRRAGRRYRAESAGLWPGRYESMVYSMACTPLKQEGLVAPAYSEREYDLPDNDADNDAIFDPNAAIPTEGNCR